MSLERGGFTDKFGNSYESYWVAKQLLNLLHEKIASVTVEPLGDDEAGVDVIIEHLIGREITDSSEVEFHQCKASNQGKDSWSLATLDSSGILAKAFFQIERNDQSQHSVTFKVISPLSFNILTNLSKSAKNNNGNPQDFYQRQIKTSQEREKIFNDLCKRLKLDISNPSDIAKAINFLSHFEIVNYANSSEDINHLKDKANFIFLNDETVKILSYLQSYPTNQNKLRTKITADVLFDDLKKAGFEVRKDIDNTQTPLALDELCQKFTDSIQLLNNTLIHRSEIDECLSSIKENTITIIKAEAGMGKSTFLYELHSKVRSEGNISVPIRLDRQRPENSADEFGKLLGFKQSPVYAMVNASKSKRVVIILDQLDAIRWTANHSNNALQVCQEIARQIISLPHIYDIKLVMACRDFDLSEDIALKNWVNDLEKSINKLNKTLSVAQEVKQITLDKLPTEQVKEMVDQVEDYESLPTTKQDILRIPIWLNFYLQIAGKSNHPPRFDSKLELISLYWHDRLKLIEEAGVDLANVQSIINEFITKASQQMQYAIPQSLLAITDPVAFERLISAGILHKNKQDKISFQHQALFDYQLGKSLYDKAIESETALLTQIGDKTAQTLTRREHLKYALNLLLQDKQKLYARSISAILFSEDIRFHLKYLAFHSLREVLEVKQPIKKLVRELIADDYLSKHFIKHSCMGNSTMVSLLAELGFITSWLNHKDVEQINKAIQLLSTVSESVPELVVKEIQPFIGLSDKWNERCHRALGWTVANDADDIFALRQQLFKLGIFPRFIDFEKLVKKHPKRVLQLIDFTFDENTESLTNDDWFKNSFIDKLRLFDAHKPEKLLNIARQLPVDVINLLLPKIYIVANEPDGDDDRLSKAWFYHTQFPQDREKFIICILDLINQASEQLANESKDTELWQLITPYLHSHNILIQHILLNMMFYLDISYANQVIEWILENPKSRLSSGNFKKEPKWLLSGSVIEKFSPHCSDEIFCKLEDIIYYAGISKNFENLQWIFECKKRGYFKNYYWGALQYFILSKLDKKRVSKKSKQLTAVLNRRFEHFKDEDFYNSSRMGGGFVVSPLPPPNKLSDKKWREILVKKDNEFKSFNGKQISEDAIVESTVYTFSRSLSTAVTNQPERFARLALTLPKDIERDYVNSIFYGLSNPSKEVQEQYKEEWQPCPLELRYKVITHFGEKPHSNNLAWLLTKDTEVINHPAMLAMLITMAKTSPHPESDKLSIYDPKKGDSASIATAHELMGTAINSCRGIAYNGIASLFWKDKNFAINHKQLIDDAISDQHPAVQITSVSMLTPFLNIDENFALQKFLDISHTDLLFTCASQAYHFFNNAFESQFRDGYIQLVKDMLVSDYDEVRKNAGRQILARWYFNDLFDNIFPTLLKTETTDKYVRLGVANVLNQFLSWDKYTHHDDKLLEPYQLILNDKDSDVSNEIQRCIQNESFWKKRNTKALIDCFIQSIDEKINVSNFLYFLKNSKDIYPYKTQLLDIFSKLMETSSDEYSFSRRANASSMISVLQKIYDEAVDDEDEDILNQCLNVWDNIFESNIYFNHSKVLHSGMLD
ncbi:hypothetical protein [Psychrobacter sp. I-STPA6b]|uniref:hypothetical protein n=1 Tax=Psychrobacter sp. I-STPA6b TaxID=2585718 RepID=UPI001D0CD6CD|nr:hypothetical protein [Psychrobacter sp. I-STPA6b]